MNTLTLKEKIIETLKMIFDPEIPVNIYDLGLIYALNIKEEGKVLVQMTLTSPACPVAQEFPGMVQDRLFTVPGVVSVSVELVWDPPWTQDKMSEAAKLALNLL